MSRRLPRSRRWIDPQDFRDLRHQAGMTRKDAADALDVTPRTIQNWETGGARVPWMAFRMLRVLRGYALPGVEWNGWTVRAGDLFSPAGRRFDAASLEYLEGVFAQARLWRQMYASTGRQKTAQTVIPFPDRRRTPAEAQKPPQAQPQRIGGIAR
jgi:DNA-binding XRE family transcriptional regulator